MRSEHIGEKLFAGKSLRGNSRNLSALTCTWMLQFYDFVVPEKRESIYAMAWRSIFTTGHFNLFMCRFYILAIC